MPHLVCSKFEIEQRVAAIAHAVIESSAFPDIVIPIMTGAMFFAADLVRALYPDINPMVAPIRVYRIPRLTVPNKWQVVIPSGWSTTIPGGIQNKRVLLIDTVYDSGATMTATKRALAEVAPRSIYTAALIWKNLPEAEGKPDFYGKDLRGSSAFLYGYGLDKEFRFRGVPEIFKD